jgi:hypothetical protein
MNIVAARVSRGGAKEQSDAANGGNELKVDSALFNHAVQKHVTDAAIKEKVRTAGKAVMF